MNKPPSSDRLRVTVSITPECRAVFEQLAASSGISLSRCMGDWLADTAEGAQFVAGKIEAARASPMTVMRELQAMTDGLGTAIQVKADEWRAAGLASLKPPSSLTGVNSPTPGKKP